MFSTPVAKTDKTGTFRLPESKNVHLFKLLGSCAEYHWPQGNQDGTLIVFASGYEAATYQAASYIPDKPVDPKSSAAYSLVTEDIYLKPTPAK